MTGTKRLLEELLVLHELEPEMLEVIVEGRTDVGVIQTFLDEHKIDAVVFAVEDRVDVSSGVLGQLGIANGMRGYVVAAARLADIKNIGNSLIFVADSDYRAVEPARSKLEDSDHLLFTDYASLECYCLTENVVRRFLRISLRATQDISAQNVLDAIIERLVDIYICRWMLTQLDNPPALVGKLERRCSIVAGRFHVDVARLLSDSMAGEKRYKSGEHVTSSDLGATFASARKLVSNDLREYIHGHDVSRILICYLLRMYPRLFREDRHVFKSAGTAEIALLCCLDFHELAQESMFSELLSRLS